MGNQGSSTRYFQCVVGYLLSPLGRGTSDATARRLLALDPRSIGMPAEPSAARLHGLRAFLDVAFVGEPENEQGVASEVTAAHSRGARRRSATA